MAPSPRKRAPSAFAQAWHETDAAFLDPTSLPVAKVPRGWERRAETVTSRDGKQKKVWRRYTTRSKTTNTTSLEDEEEEEQDSRYRPVKKLQRVGPKERELSVVVPKSNRRAFRATRWDRRKSVLPRKNSVPQDPVHEAENETSHLNKIIDEDEDDMLPVSDVVEEVEVSNECNSELGTVDREEPVLGLSAIIVNDRRRSTFTFSVETARGEQHNPVVTGGSTEGTIEIIEPTAELIHSTIESECDQGDGDLRLEPSSSGANHANEDAQLPEETGLHVSSYEHAELSSITALCHDSGEAVGAEEIARTVIEGSGIEVESEERSAQEFVEEEDNATEANDSPILDTEASDAQDPIMDVPQSLDLSAEGEATEDTEMSEITLDLDMLSTDMGSASNIVDLPAQEDSTLTEASLQLELQQDWNTDPEASVGERDVNICPEQQQENGVLDVKSDGRDLIVSLENDATVDQEVNAPELAEETSSDNVAVDIADGLSLMSSITKPRESVGRRLRSPSPPLPSESGPDDVTTTMYLDEDTALLKDFLTRAAASKADKAATIVRRSSLQNQRDSDAVRQALASPRKILEDKDPNSPAKYDNDVTLDLSQTLTLNMDDQLPLSPHADTVDPGCKPSKSSRRSTRTRKSRLPAPPSATQATQGPKNISLRRTDGGEPVVLKRTEAQELGLLTRNNTRKNKHGAISVNYRLLKLNAEALSAPNQEDCSLVDIQPGKKNVRWDETLAYFQEHTETIANIMAEAESLATPDELSMSTSDPASKKAREVKDKNATPRMRRVRGLGAANGTPGKGLLAPASLLPVDVHEENDTDTADKQKHLPKSSKIKKLTIAPTVSDTPSLNSPAKKVPLPLLASPAKKVSLSSPAKRAPPLEIAPIGIDLEKNAKATRERKSRLATPRKVQLPQPGPTLSSVTVDGKENRQGKGIGGASPKKGLRLPQPQVIIPPKAESGLPRRRAARKL